MYSLYHRTHLTEEQNKDMQTTKARNISWALADLLSLYVGWRYEFGRFWEQTTVFWESSLVQDGALSYSGIWNLNRLLLCPPFISSTVEVANVDFTPPSQLTPALFSTPLCSGISQFGL